jgi:hypothetical protein
MMYADPFYRITYLIKEEIRKHKWLEGEKGRALSWKEARAQWTEAHREQYEKFLVETLSFPDLVPAPPLTREANGWRHLLRERNFSLGIICGVIASGGSQDRHVTGALKAALQSTVPLVLR